MLRILILAAALGLSVVRAGLADGGRLQEAADEMRSQSESGAGFSLFSYGGPLAAFGAQSGKDASGQNLTHASGFRIASITKTYVAATALRLMEEGLLALDDPIAKYISPARAGQLSGDGYDPSLISVRHVLSHSGGFYDHAEDEAYISRIIATPEAAWTRDMQIQAMVDWGDPVGLPGEKYSYSDSGFVILGEIIEKVTGRPLARAVRSYLRLDALGLGRTYWETVETPKNGDVSRVHQTMLGHDTYGWNSTIDMFGGGGLVATMEDVAKFFYALFNDRVFRNPETLQLMVASQGLPKDSVYRLGIYEYDFNGVRAYGHSGYWGTVVAYIPSQNRAVAAAATHRAAYNEMLESLRNYVRESEKP